MTVIIALLGLVGYTSDETGRRRKEVALRKINGAQSWEIIGIFISGIGKFSVVAVVLGCALSWFVFDMLLKSVALRSHRRRAAGSAGGSSHGPMSGDRPDQSGGFAADRIKTRRLYLNKITI